MARSEMEREAMASIKPSVDDMTDAACVLIRMVKAIEAIKKDRLTSGKLSLNVELDAGGVEEWEITIERTASSH